VPTWLVESYAAEGDVAEQRERAASAARSASGVRYVRTTVVPGDQVVLHQFEAASSALLREAVAAARLDCDRIVEVLEIGDPNSSTERGSR